MAGTSRWRASGNPGVADTTPLDGPEDFLSGAA
jgi:hypothetical protein